MEKKTYAKIGKASLFFVPLAFGLMGFFVVARQSFTDSLFLSISLYMMNYQDTPPNFWIELGRWTAPLASASGILLAFSVLRKRLRDYWCYRSGQSIAVYGPESEKQELLARLGRDGIDGGERLVRAQRYILLGSEEENLAFYTEHSHALAHRMVFLCSRTLPAQSVSAANLRLFCPEETAARLFWKTCDMYRLSESCHHQLQIVFVGFGRLGEELLKYGLQDNIFSPRQRIEYHIFGEGAAFRAVHRELAEIGDPIHFHGMPWYEELSMLEQAQMVIVLEQENQLSLLQSLLLATRRMKIHVFTAESTGVELLAGRERLVSFSWRREVLTPERILEDGLFERAKRINLRYASLYGGATENEETKEAEWQKLDAFTRYSNISSADYHEVRLEMLKAMGQPADPRQIPADCLELLAQLEHIRWCRYHFLNNWRQGALPAGQRKDAGQRIHTDLVPYESLSEGEKEKDRETIRVLLSVKI